MSMIMCDKGHYYDNSKFFQCPYCGVAFDFRQYTFEEDDDRTVLLGDEDDDRTVFLRDIEDDDKTVLLRDIEDDDKTVLLEDVEEDDRDDNK